MKIPSLPKTVEAAGGTVRILQVKRAPIHDDGETCVGVYDDTTRTVRIHRALPLRHRWLTLFHELTHVALIDSGLDNRFQGEEGENLVEQVCEAVATSRMREMFG